MARFFFSKRYQIHRVSLVFVLVVSLVLGIIPSGLFKGLSTTDTPSAQAAESQVTADTPTSTVFSDMVAPDPLLNPQSSLNPESIADPSSLKSKAKEIVENRTAKTKTFDLGAGKKVMEFYSAPVHYQENGTWKEIDPKIKPSAQGGFENGANVFKAHFGAKGKSDSLSSFEYSGAKVTYALAETQTADVEPTIEQERITYKNILPEIDLREIVTGIGVKEDIILKKYTGKNSFTFEMKTAGVEAKKEADGSIGFYRMGQEPKEKVFSIPKPFMQDSSIDPSSGESARSDSVTMDVSQKGANTFVTITADDAWLKAPQRVYPVYVDPATDLNVTNNNVFDDAYVRSDYPNNNYDASWNATLGIYELKTGYIDGTTGTNYSFFKMDTSPLRGKLIHYAAFYARCRWSYVHSTPKEVWLDAVNWDWSANGITWNNQPSSYNISWTSVAENNWAGFDVTGKVADWVMGRAGNYGFKLHENGNGANWWKKFIACETGLYIPHIGVEYYDPSWIDATPYGNSANTKSGYMNLTWGGVPGAAGYKLWIYNGNGYQDFDVGNTTSWSTQNRYIWPTPSEIAAGRYALHYDGWGAELADDPSPVYRNSGGSYPYNQNYWFRVTAYNWCSETDLWANCTTPTLPDRTAPPSPQNPSVSGTNGTNGSGTCNVTVNWTGVDDYATGTNYGTSYYRINLTKTNLKTNAVTTEAVNVTHSGAGAHSYTFANEPDSTRYQANITTYDNNGNYSGVAATATWESADRTNPSQSSLTVATETTATGDLPVTASGTDDRALGKLVLSIRKPGVSDKQEVGTRVGIGQSYTAGFNLDTTKLTDGQYLLGVTAYDTEGNSLNSNEATITVANGQFGPFSFGIDRGSISNRYGKVNPLNGNFVITQKDIDLPGKGPGTELSRVYNNQSKIDGPLGWGWRFDLPELVEHDDGSVSVVEGDGTRQHFLKSLDDTYTAPAGNFTTLKKETNGTYTWKFKDKNKYVFDLANKKLFYTDKNNNTVTYQYNAQNKLEKIIDPSSRETTLTYAIDTGRLDTISDFSGRSYHYTYDPSGNLKEVRTKIDDTRDYVLGFGYDPNHNMTSYTDANSNTASFVYTADKLTQVKDPGDSASTAYVYDQNLGKVTETDPKGYTTIYIFEANGNLASITNAKGGLTSYIYDSSYLLTNKIDPLKHETKYTYNSIGNIRQEIDPVGHTTDYTYDPINNNDLLKKILGFGTTQTAETTYTYDPCGNMLTDGVSSYTYNSDGSVSLVRDSKNNTVTANTYNEVGELIRIVDALGNETTATFDPAGNKLGETDGMKKTTTYTYDKLGRMLSAVALAKDSTPTTTTYSYDFNGNRLTAATSESTSTWEYDAQNRVTRSIEPGNKIKRLEYDLNGNVATETAEDNKVTVNTYDELDRLIKVQYPDGKTVTYEYDAAGNRTKMTDSSGITTYTYNACNELVTEAQPKKTITYTYDVTHKLTGKSTTGYTTMYKYDNKENLTDIIDGITNSTVATFTCNGNNNRTLDSYKNGAKANYTYDVANKLSELKNVDKNGQTIATFGYTYYKNNLIKDVGSNDGTTTYEYDDKNMLSKITEPSGTTTTYLYDTKGNRTSTAVFNGSTTATTTYSYDPATNQLLSIAKPGSPTITYAYNARGNMIERRKSGESTATYEYSPDNQLTKVTKPTGESASYAYDGDNRRVSKTGSAPTSVSALPIRSAVASSLEYDYYPASAAVDGNLSTRWSSAFSDPQWIYVDLGAWRSIDKVVLTWEGACAKAYQVQVSDDATNWSTVYSTTTGDGGTDEIALPQGTRGRYVRMYGTQRVTPYGYSLWEFQVYGPVSNLALGGPTVASSLEYDYYPASAVVDGSMGTRWSSQFSDPQWIYVDLGATKDVGKVILTWEGACASAYQIQVSDDAANWSTVYSTTTGDGGTDEIALPQGTKGRYVRMYGTQRATPYGYSLWEFEVYGSATTYYVYDGDLLLAELDAYGAITSIYTYDDKGAPVCVNKGSNIYYFHYSGQGDVVALTDSNGATAATYKYDAWGNILSKTGTVDTPFGYRGKFGYVYDKETGLYFLKSRYYDPETGRFTSKDRFKGFEERPQSQNPYTYSENDPVNKVDPSGEDATFTDGYGLPDPFDPLALTQFRQGMRDLINTAGDELEHLPEDLKDLHRGFKSSLQKMFLGNRPPNMGPIKTIGFFAVMGTVIGSRLVDPVRQAYNDLKQAASKRGTHTGIVKVKKGTTLTWTRPKSTKHTKK